MNKKLEIMETIKVGKLEYLGLIMTNSHRYGLVQQILQGKVFAILVLNTGVFRAAVDKVILTRTIANTGSLRRRYKARQVSKKP